MNSGSAIIVAIGQLPPPVTGLSYITSQVVARLRTFHDVRAANIAADSKHHGLAKHAQRIYRVLSAIGLLAVNSHRPRRVCYLVCEGGLGLIYTALLASTARIGGYSIFLHHHSFDYIDRPRMLMRAVLVAGGPRLVHLFLCRRMQERFASAYAIAPNAIVLSNAAFVEPKVGSRTTDRPLTVGLLSNLTKEKGLHTFIELVREIYEEGLDARAILAGPIVSKDDQLFVASACNEFGALLEYRGPVYGPEKDAFYEEIDVFIFPTEYSHEAEPTVLFEALSAGKLVIAFDRGCIAGQICGSGLLVPSNESFLMRSLAYLRVLSSQLETLRAERNYRIATYARLHRSGSTSARELFERIAYL